MSQFTFTSEEDALVVSALQYLAEVQTSQHGSATEEVAALLEKIASAKTAAKPKKAKAEPVAQEAEEKVAEQTISG